MQVNKVSVKIRAALITEVYRKALSISSTTISKFSTGEVHMSIYTIIIEDPNSKE